MLNDHTNKRFCFILAMISEILKVWHMEENLASRTGHGTFEWTKAQVDKAYMEHVCKFVKLLKNVSKLQGAGFVITADEVQSIQEDVIAEDCFADFLGRSVLSIMGRRLARGLQYTLAFPKRLILLCVPEKT